MTEAETQTTAQNAEAATANPTEAAAATVAAPIAATGTITGGGEGVATENPTGDVQTAGVSSVTGNTSLPTAGIAQQNQLSSFTNSGSISGNPIQPTSLAGTAILLTMVEEFVQDAKIDFEHLLTGMANSTTEAVHALEMAALYLKNHLHQHTSGAIKRKPSTKGETTNV